MRIIYPYNEILPKKKAHDIFIVQECAAFAQQGWDVTLLVGKNSKKSDLFSHYQIPTSENLHIEELFILRKNNPFNLSWNTPFFLNCQRAFKKMRPDSVFLSVRKQAAYHLLRKIPGIRYVYEVHELCFYPQTPPPTTQEMELEKRVLARVDLITVTTDALKKILLNPPYNIKVPIEVIPLAVQAGLLPPPPPINPLTLMYVGQLYVGQGLHILLAALARVSDVNLKVVGGTGEEILRLKALAKDLSISDRIEFLGFIPPNRLPAIVKNAHAFVAPFENTGRMPYVAHTKLFEYCEWGRPIIAPHLPIVEEHFKEIHKQSEELECWQSSRPEFEPAKLRRGSPTSVSWATEAGSKSKMTSAAKNPFSRLFAYSKGALLFEPGNVNSLASCIDALKQEPVRQKLQQEILLLAGKFSWQSRAEIYCTLDFFRKKSIIDAKSYLHDQR